ncbi:hypothetical protein AUQ48_17055 [Kocuria flava]|uniref:DDE Tnp4 domain-containing protein n=1 Tax=Kocuria flava TaxID=446860 RepID=A0A2N4SXS9_9MICC|nr:transposase family protein [Kocuria flava]PLC10759.1 hypothetical protein AUQ48_17055 [Kocuria flava]
MFTYSAICDVPIETLDFLATLLHRHRKTHDRRPAQRAGTARTQAKLVLRWYRDSTRVVALGHDHGLSQATAYRYLHEGIDVLAAEAPQLHETLAQAQTDELPYLTLDGTLIPTDRLAERTEAGNHAWYSGKHKSFGGNIQVISDPTGFPLWASPVEPGSTHDITAAREHCLGALYPAAATGLPTLADKGYQGAGIGVHTPVKGSHLGVDNRAYNGLLTGMRSIGERANALLTQRWTVLRHVTLSPSRIGAIIAGALVLTTLERGAR